MRWTVVVPALLLWQVFGASAVEAQRVTVQGQVVEAVTEEPIPGATVRVEDGTQQTTTDAEGEFTLVVPEPTSTLVVTREGYAIGRVRLQGETNVVVRLSETMVMLDEVVVVGYGTQRKSDVTGSVATVSSAEIEDKAVMTVEQALQGRVAGVQITQVAGGAEPRTDFLIRGQNSIKASNQPLIILDGIPFEGSLSSINQNSIASINILKDASAAAIYGARGSNGVVLITTKRGGGEPQLSYEGYAGIQDFSELPRVMTGAEFGEFKCTRLEAFGNCEAVLTGTELANLEAGRSTNWLDLATRQGFQQQHNLSVAGGTGGTDYYVSASVLDVKGVARNDEFDRYTLRVNLNQEVKPWINVGTNTLMALVDRSGLNADFDDAFFMNPLTNPFQDDGELTITPWPEDIFWNNPLQGFNVIDSDRDRRIFTSNFVEVEAPFLEGLSYRFNGGINWLVEEERRYFPRNTLTGFETQGRADTEDARRFDWTVENLLRLNRNFGAHTLDLTGLFSIQENDSTSNRLRSEGFPNDVLTFYQANVGAVIIPGYAVKESRLISQMGRINYDYADRYLLTLTARRDGYSGFGEDRKYGVFPSAAFGWNLVNEPFWPEIQAVNQLKLRASWGKNGNQAIAPYQTLARLRERSYIDGNQTAPGFLPRTLGNPELHWETTTQINLGLDFGLWGNRLSGSLDAYTSSTEDLLLDRLISPVHGITQIAENIGEVENRGVELQLAGLILDRGGFSWNTDFNIAANRNEIVDLYGNNEDDVLNRWFIGHPIDVNYTYTFAGIFQEGDDIASSAQPRARPGDVRVVDINGDGEITPEDRTILGSLEPSYTAGLVNTFRFGGWMLSAFFNAVQGIERPNPLLDTNLVHNEVRRNTLFLTYWTPQNPINTYPRNDPDANVYGVDFFEDASFVRLKDLTLSYDIPLDVTDRLGVQALRLYVNGRNLWTFTDWSGLDPEILNRNQRNIPLERTIIGGINVRF